MRRRKILWSLILELLITWCTLFKTILWRGFFFLLSVAEQQQEQAYHQSNSLERAGGGEGGGLHNGRKSNPRKRFYKSDELVVSYQKLHIERDGWDSNRSAICDSEDWRSRIRFWWMKPLHDVDVETWSHVYYTTLMLTSQKRTTSLLIESIKKSE